MRKKRYFFWVLVFLIYGFLLGGCEFDWPDPFPDPPSIITIGCNVQGLIDAINDANADPNHTTIILAQGCSYPLLGYDNVEREGANGLPVISSPITIQGNDAYIWRQYISSTAEFRIFYITYGGTLTLNDLSLSYGKVISSEHFNQGGAIYVFGGVLVLNQTLLELNEAESGGAIYNLNGDVTLNNTTVRDNDAVMGGGIFNYMGTFTLNGSEVSDNTAEINGGGIVNWEEGTLSIISNTSINSNSAGIYGGGVFSGGSLTINDSEFINNQTDQRGGGLYFNSISSPLSIYRGSFVENTAGGSGGGAFVSQGQFTITNSGFTRNHADLGGGGLAVTEDGTVDGFSLFLENTAGSGGGIFVGYPNVVTIEDCVISKNEASDSGGGINNWFDLTIINSTIFDNHAEEGGGITTSGPLTIIGSTIYENNATSKGGGIYAMLDSAGNSSLDILNTTISGNQAPLAAGIYTGHNATIVHSTIANNLGTSNGGLYIPKDLNIKNSIVADNQPQDCNLGGNGSLNSSGDNLDSDGSCSGFTITGYPWLGPLADNGGTTRTHALGMFSPATDAAPDCTDVALSPVSIDQRGEPRPYGTECDLGAYETQTTPTVDIDLFRITFRMNVNCRIGPHYDHMVVFTYLAGETAYAVGRNKDGTWLAAYMPEGDGEVLWCWVPDAFLDRDFDKSVLTILEHLPSPDALEPQEGGPQEEGCWWTPPVGGDPVCKVPCPDDASSGGPCNP